MTISYPQDTTTGKQLGWSKYTPFYHVTPKSRVPSILVEGLRIPTEEQIALSRFIEPQTFFPGIYLDEDKEMILTLAGIAIERGFSEPLTLLKVWVEDIIRWISDPDGPPGSIIALDSIPPELVWPDIGEITKSMIPEES